MEWMVVMNELQAKTVYLSFDPACITSTQSTVIELIL